MPGIGEELAHRLHERLGVETLAELELAAHATASSIRIPRVARDYAEVVNDPEIDVIYKPAADEPARALDDRSVARRQARPV